MLLPNKTKYKKQFKGKLKGKTSKGFKIIYGKYALKIIEEAKLTSNQIESAKYVIIKKMKKIGFLWTRVFPDIPITKKPTENRMGKGKGNVFFFIVKAKKGQILFEINGFSKYNSIKILKSASKKLPVKTKIIYK